MFVGAYETTLFSDGLVLVNYPGKSKTHQISTNRVAMLVNDLRDRGFFQLTRQSLTEEFARLAAEQGGWGKVDGCTVTLTSFENGKTNAVDWDDPEEYLKIYPSAKRARAFHDCINLISSAINN
jgi:hypothetical protein